MEVNNNFIISCFQNLDDTLSTLLATYLESSLPSLPPDLPSLSCNDIGKNTFTKITIINIAIRVCLVFIVFVCLCFCFTFRKKLPSLLIFFLVHIILYLINYYILVAAKSPRSTYGRCWIWWCKNIPPLPPPTTFSTSNLTKAQTTMIITIKKKII